jgi:hypothetical protein
MPRSGLRVVHQGGRRGRVIALSSIGRLRGMSLRQWKSHVATLAHYRRSAARVTAESGVLAFQPVDQSLDNVDVGADHGPRPRDRLSVSAPRGMDQREPVSCQAQQDPSRPPVRQPLEAQTRSLRQYPGPRTIDRVRVSRVAFRRRSRQRRAESASTSTVSADPMRDCLGGPPRQSTRRSGQHGSKSGSSRTSADCVQTGSPSSRTPPSPRG